MCAVGVQGDIVSLVARSSDLPIEVRSVLKNEYGAEGGSRTRTTLRSTDRAAS
jgi:hypothetical protein